MASVGLLPFLILGCLSLVQAQAGTDHMCCATSTALPDSFFTDPACTRAKCNAFARATTDTHFSDFLTGCTIPSATMIPTMAPPVYRMVVPTVLSCLGNAVTPAAYNRLAYPGVMSLQTVSDRINQMALVVACAKSANTVPCHLATNLIVGARLGHQANFSASTLSAPSRYALKTCIAPADQAEWNDGSASCSYSRTNQLFVESTGTCAECKLAFDQASAPFCSNHFSTATTKRYGTRCSSRRSAETADRIAQSLHTAWTTANTVTLPTGITLDISSTSANCSRLLRHVACSSTLGECQSASTINAWCTTSCKANFMSACSATDTKATEICTALGTSADGSCTTFDLGNAAAATDYELVASASSRVNRFDLSVCVPGSTNATIAPTYLILSSLVEASCEAIQQCIGRLAYASSPRCTNFSATVTASGDVTPAVVVQGISAQLPALIAGTLTTVTTQGNEKVLQLKGSSNNSPASVPVLAYPLLVVSAVFVASH